MAFWKLWKNKFSVLSQLNVIEWGLLFEAWVLMLFFYVQMRWFPPRDFALQSAQPISVSTLLMQKAERIQFLVELSSRLLPEFITCLHRALTLHWLLSQFGISSRLRIGMHRNLSLPSAHAWVEVNGIPLGEKSDLENAFVPFE